MRLVVITDRRMAAPRSVEAVVHEALAAGARTIQLRDKDVVVSPRPNDRLDVQDGIEAVGRVGLVDAQMTVPGGTVVSLGMITMPSRML